MLTHTFCHVPGIGVKTEARLWSEGILSWDALLAASGKSASLAHQLWVEHLRDSLAHHASRNPNYFFERLPTDCQWRLFADFRADCAFLDIETTGLGWSDDVTTIALYDGNRIRHYVNGLNLSEFLRDVQEYRVLVSYNGKSFDVPFLERYFRIRLPQAHIDLRHVLRSLGLKGGLKACERQLGISRPGLEEVDGFVGVLLWRHYRRNRDSRALETLLAYNIADAVNLERLLVEAYNRKLAKTPFTTSHALPTPSVPASPFRPNPDVLELLTGIDENDPSRAREGAAAPSQSRL
jgi:uncharacterized protein YprB with RNaseH-like and TPR domain